MISYSRWLFLGLLTCLLALVFVQGHHPAGKRRCQPVLRCLRVRRGRSRSNDNRSGSSTNPCQHTILPPEERPDPSESRTAYAAPSLAEPDEIPGGLGRLRFFETSSGRGNLSVPLYLSLQILVI